MMINEKQLTPQELPFFWQELNFDRLYDIFQFVPVMEKEFNRVERIIGKELTLEAAYFYYDFYDLAHELKHEIKALDLNLSVDHHSSLEKLRFGQDLFQSMDRLSLCKLLLSAVEIDHYNHGFFERKMKDKTIVKLLNALQLSFR